MNTGGRHINGIRFHDTMNVGPKGRYTHRHFINGAMVPFSCWAAARNEALIAEKAGVALVTWLKGLFTDAAAPCACEAQLGEAV